jgi:type II secretory pathway component PulC
VALKPKAIKKSLTLVLEGVIIVDDYYAAFVRDRANAMAGSRRVMVGETIDSYNVKSITGDELVLTGEDGSIEVLNLYDSGHKVNRRNVRTAVTPTQSQQARPGPSRTTPVRRPLPLQRRTTTTR